MRYLCLVYGQEKDMENFGDAECVAYDQDIRNSGHCIASEALQPVATATTVRVRNGQTSIIDGPFAETKEALAGFYMVEARDLNE
ncbi:MAG: YciI family protein, partial [Nevskiales bacterium]